MEKNNYNRVRLYFPNLITFLSLACAIVSIVLSIRGFILQAGLLILLSVVFDVSDGFFARKLKVESNFGIQLDSLADIVCFGVAPMILVLQHLTIRDDFSFWFLPLIILPIWAGAFRLARFNLQPIKESSRTESLGLAITNSGVILSLTVLSDLSYNTNSLPLGIYILLILVLSYLMISKLKFPSLSWFVPKKVLFVVYFALGATLVLFSSFFTSLLVLSLGIIAASVSRYLYLLMCQPSSTS